MGRVCYGPSCPVTSACTQAMIHCKLEALQRGTQQSIHFSKLILKMENIIIISSINHISYSNSI